MELRTASAHCPEYFPVMTTSAGPSFSKWAALLFAGDILVFLLSVSLGYWAGVQDRELGRSCSFKIIWSPVVALGVIYVIILYIGELYNYYLDFRRRENIGQVILWALAAAVVALLIFCYPTPKLLPRRFVEWQSLAFIWPLVAWRYLFSALALPLRLKRKVIIVGAGQSGLPYPGSHPSKAPRGSRTRRVCG